MNFARPLLLVASALLLAGCQVASYSKAPNYSDTPPMDLRASAILFDDVTTPSTEPGRVESQLAPTAGERLRGAIESHYFANSKGATGAPQLLFTLSDVSVTETALPVPEDQLSQLFHNYADARYDGRVLVTVDASSSGQFGQRGFAQVEATRSLELGNVSPEARTKYLNDMMDQMIKEVVAELDEQILANLGGLVNPTIYGREGTVNGGDMVITPQLSGRWDKMKNWK